MTSHKDISDLIILDANGIDGLNVVNFNETSVGNISAGSSVDSQLNLNVPLGKKSYLVLRVNYQISGRDVDELVTIGIGSLSQDQKDKRRKNVVNKNGKNLLVQR